MSTWRRGESRPYNPNQRLAAPDALPSDRAILEGLLPSSLKQLSKPSVSGNTAVPIRPKDLQYLGSYNWTDANKATIMVPGAPREWQSRATPFQVQADTGFSFVDQNGYRVPSTPLLPLFRAVDAVAAKDTDTEQLEWGLVDFVTDRNNLRKLLRWINDGNSDVPIKDFRIDLQLAGKKTVLMTRWEKRNREAMSGYTFGFGFEKASTRPANGCEGGTGHHRITKYELDGLTFVIRFEVDACAPASRPQAQLPRAIVWRSGKPASEAAARGREDNVDDLSNYFSGLNVTSRDVVTSSSSATQQPDITIVRGGYQVPQSAIMEMTTRSERNVVNLDWKENYPQLFLSQTSQHILGVHSRGFFRSIQIRRIDSPEMRAIDTACQKSFKQLTAFLKVIQDLVIEHGERGRLSLVCQGGNLKVYERESQKSCLPDDVMDRFGSA